MYCPSFRPRVFYSSRNRLRVRTILEQGPATLWNRPRSLCCSTFSAINLTVVTLFLLDVSIGVIGRAVTQSKAPCPFQNNQCPYRTSCRTDGQERGKKTRQVKKHIFRRGISSASSLSLSLSPRHTIRFDSFSNFHRPIPSDFSGLI